MQKYVENPMLLTGGRKFDIRVWVLVDCKYKVWMYKEGVLRTTCVPWGIDDLSNEFVWVWGMLKHFGRAKHGLCGHGNTVLLA